MREMFHFTRPQYLPNIASQGLRINTGHSGFCKDSRFIIKQYIELYGVQPVFLTDDPEWVVEKMLGSKRDAFELLEVCVDELPVEFDVLMDGTGDKMFNNHSFICKSNVDYWRIKV